MAYSFTGAHYLNEGAPQFPPRTHYTAAGLPVLDVLDVNVDNSVPSKQYVDSKAGSVAYQLTNFYTASVKLVITEDDIYFILPYDPPHDNKILLQLNNVEPNTWATIDGKNADILKQNDRVLVADLPGVVENGIYKVLQTPLKANNSNQTFLHLERVDFTHGHYIPHHLHVPIEQGEKFAHTIWINGSITLNHFSQETIDKIIAGEIIDKSIINQLQNVLKVGTDKLEFHKIGTAEPNSLVSGGNQPIKIKFDNSTKAQILNGCFTLFDPVANAQNVSPVNAHQQLNEIWGVNDHIFSDYGILKLSAGGGTNKINKTSIYLRGFDTDHGRTIRMYVGDATNPRVTVTSTGVVVAGSITSSSATINGNASITGSITSSSATINGNAIITGEIVTNSRITCKNDVIRSSCEIVPGTNSQTGYIEFWKDGSRFHQLGYDYNWDLENTETFKIRVRKFNGNGVPSGYNEYLKFIPENVKTGDVKELRIDTPLTVFSTAFIQGNITVGATLGVNNGISTGNRISCTDTNRNSVELVSGANNVTSGYVEFWETNFRQHQLGYKYSWQLFANAPFKIEAQRYNGGIKTNTFYEYLRFQPEDTNVEAQLQTDVPFISNSRIYAPDLYTTRLNPNVVVEDLTTPNLYHAPFYVVGDQFILNPIPVSNVPNTEYELLQYTLPNEAVPRVASFLINEAYVYNLKILRFDAADKMFPFQAPAGMDTYILAFKNEGGVKYSNLGNKIGGLETTISDDSSLGNGNNDWFLQYSENAARHSSIKLKVTTHQQASTWWQLVITRIS